ncbi:hypothetical protein NLJ89_g8102 [Agrocybe chaxingu]|uniref:Uncharacterized protein n=1 Tax=Agrocybe chaxingu TaxID=84603 RepID=A0A9W8JVJ1_9AGAR|nr:hypothetical protein NLJ89_g8102 [Agrocybe chaxingu]
MIRFCQTFPTCTSLTAYTRRTPGITSHPIQESPHTPKYSLSWNWGSADKTQTEIHTVLVALSIEETGLAPPLTVSALTRETYQLVDPEQQEDTQEDSKDRYSTKTNSKTTTDTYDADEEEGEEYEMVQTYGVARAHGAEDPMDAGGRAGRVECVAGWHWWEASELRGRGEDGGTSDARELYK